MDKRSSDEFYMKAVLDQAADALEVGELPIAAVVVLDGTIIGSGSTVERRENRFLGHAELTALQAADKLGLSLGERRAARLFTSLEPCLMCTGAAMSFFLGEIAYSLESPSDGAIELVRSWGRERDDFPAYRLPAVTGGLMRDRTIRLFQDYVSRHPAGPMRRWAEGLAKLG